MSVLSGFLATWSEARATFGEGTPSTGSGYDASASLDRLKSAVESAAPASRWTGSASAAYNAVNTEHGRTIGEIGSLDKRLAAHVDQSAQVVTAGRRDLDAVRKWVVDAAASVPPGAAGERMLLPIVSKGIGQVADVVQKANGELGVVGASIRGVDAEYRLLGNQKFAPKEGPQLGTDDDKMGAPDVKEQAAKDVKDALDGKGGAAKRVDDTLSGINPGQALTPQQDAYLTEMQSQQHGMGISDLADTEKKLGEHGKIIADSWQLMSNDDVYFSGADGKPGSAEQLPESVQKTLQQAAVVSGNGPGDIRLVHADDLNKISAIVKDGNPEFQTGTELDRGMMRAADAVMDKYFPQVRTDEVTGVAQGIFESAGRDHQIVHDHLLGTHGDNGDDFLHDINTIDWQDDGRAAGSLVSWTHDGAVGPESDIASATAEKYAQYIGTHEDELMDISNGHTLGDWNPELVKGYAHGLTTFMSDIASLSSGNPNDRFDFLDAADPERPMAKGLFAVLATQHDAYVEFNGAADQLALDRAHQYAENVKHGVPVSENDTRLLEGAVVKGLVDSGSAEAAHALDLSNAEAAEWRKLAYETGVSGLSGVAGPVGGPLVGAFGSAMESSFLGTPPDTSRPVIPDMPSEESARFVLNALIADGVDVKGIDPAYMLDGRIASLEELKAAGATVPADVDMQGDLNRVLDSVVGAPNNPADKYADKYEQTTKDPGAK